MQWFLNQMSEAEERREASCRQSACLWK